MKQNWISLRGCWSCKSCQKNVWQLFKERDITTRFRDSAMFSCQRLYLVRIQLMGHVQHPLNKSRVSIGPIPIQDMHGLGAETVTLPHFCPYKSSSVAKLLFSISLVCESKFAPPFVSCHLLLPGKVLLKGTTKNKLPHDSAKLILPCANQNFGICLNRHEQGNRSRGSVNI